MPEEGEKKIEELLKKLEAFTSTTPPLPFKKKPQYVSAVEKELEKPSLNNNEYIKVPFNPITELFSAQILYYFLVTDGIVRYNPNLYVGEFEIPLAQFIKVIESGRGDGLFIMYTKMPFVFIIRSDSVEFTIVHEIRDKYFYNLSAHIRAFFRAKGVAGYSDDSGISLLLTTADIPETHEVETNIVASHLENVPWENTTIQIKIAEEVNPFSLHIYYKLKEDSSGKYVWVFIPASEVEDYWEYVITNVFKEKKT